MMFSGQCFRAVTSYLPLFFLLYRISFKLQGKIRLNRVGYVLKGKEKLKSLWEKSRIGRGKQLTCHQPKVTLSVFWFTVPQRVLQSVTKRLNRHPSQSITGAFGDLLRVHFFTQYCENGYYDNNTTRVYG
jgi:hypothetical protein